ncbi:lipopolysaccharide biosynthesis protein [Microbacterium sp.]|uniref:lipopolysaccharide biosynthesis protein n=1 Tax=Microbacterium sp. TaxID=51671 RepID=UPI003A8B9887
MTTSARRVASDSVVLVVGNASTAALGLVFWIVATALYPVEAVGRATTAVTTGTVLASVANLSFGPLLERFLPASGRARPRVVWSTLGVSALSAAMWGGGYAALLPGTALFASAAERIGFALAVVVLAAFAILDSALIGLQRARWVFAKNVAHAVAKLLAVTALAGSGGGSAIVGGWIVTTAVAVAAVEMGLWATRTRWAAPADPPALPPTRELAQYGLVSLGWMLAQALPGIAIPTIVILRTGVETAAYYNIAWTIVTASLMMTAMATGPFIAAASRPDAEVRTLLRPFVIVLIGVSVLRGVGVGLLGPVALHLYGPDYAAGGGMLLMLMGLAHAISGVGLLYGALARVARRIVYPMAVQLLSSVLVIVLVWAWIDAVGITAVGWAYLVHDIVVLVAAVPPLIVLLRRVRATGRL